MGYNHTFLSYFSSPSLHRAKNYELKYGSKLTFSDMVPPELEKPTKDSGVCLCVCVCVCVVCVVCVCVCTTVCT